MTDRADYAELRKNWRPRWLSSIQEFADLDTQRTKWLDPENTNPHWSFVECMCCYFDDIGLHDDNPGYEGWVRHEIISPQEAAAVAEFHALAKAYRPPNGDSYDNAAVLCDPKWLSLVEAARLAQSRLAEIIADEGELELLLEP